MLPLHLLLLAVSPALARPLEGNSAPVVESAESVEAVEAAKSSNPPRSQIVYYAAFPSTGYKPCTDLSEGVKQLKYINNTKTDTQAALFQVDARKELILGIPGTASDIDRDTDLDFPPLPTILLATPAQTAKCTRAAIKAALAVNPTYNVVISGHSLGGAIAHLAFGSLKPQALNVANLFTYGSPRVGDQKFADYIDSLAGASDTTEGIAHRVTHYNDPVPRLPPSHPIFTKWEFIHPRTEYWESTMNVTQAETFRCFGQETTDCLFSISPALNGDAHTSYAGLRNLCNTK
ncbi:putative feruloyl esterase A-like protein [Cladobotryum mycophilum]|uniref:Feruloyl esterase A-like protein n=1 Tax=Cladobotryum mycophilum TaxID=491253 RepID=A0ABR0SRB1_9HYPO